MWGTENVWLVALLGFMAFISNVLYMLGGTEGFGKWMRRFIASAILAGAASLGAIALGRWVWQYLLMFPCLAIGFSLPYGAEEAIWKIIKRTLFALGVLSACVIGLWATGFTVFGLVIAGPHSIRRVCAAPLQRHSVVPYVVQLIRCCLRTYHNRGCILVPRLVSDPPYSYIIVDYPHNIGPVKA